MEAQEQCALEAVFERKRRPIKTFEKLLPTVDPNLQNVATPLDNAAQQFVLWSLATLGLSYEQRGAADFVLNVPEQHRAELGGETVTFCFESNGPSSQQSADCLTLDSPLVGWLIDQLRQLDDVQHSAPTQQPVSVHQITQQIFAAYEVKDGSVHLSGCTLEDRPFLRITRLEMDHDSPARLGQVFFDTQGRQVDERLVRALGLEQLKPADAVPRLSQHELQRWLGAVEVPASGPSAGESVVRTIVWCKHAQIKISFAIGEASAEQRFSGWAQQLVDGTQKPPPFCCPETGRESYRLDSTDDGRLTVAEAVAVCEETGRRLLVTELETCSVTGKKVGAGELETCPVTLRSVLRNTMASCLMCGQSVSPTSIKHGQCLACRTLKPVSKDDPRMARVLGEYPKLDRWSRWRLAETARVYILIASTMIKRLLVVVEKDSLDLERIAIGSRFSAQWSEAPLADRDHYLKNSN